jgi:predicted DNA-binding transcriptional regulator AlpA
MSLQDLSRTIDEAPAPQPDETGLKEQPLLIPIPRAAELLGISRSAAYRCAASGDLPTTHLGGRVYVVTARLQSLLEPA